MKKYFLLFMLSSVIFTSGCVTSLPYWVRRSVVHDDWVYDKEEKILYRRYIPDGVTLPGNKVLLSKHSKIDAENDKIIVFKNYEEAVSKTEGDFTVSSESVEFIPQNEDESEQN